MISKDLCIEVYNTDGIQYAPSFRNLRFAKAFQGGEDLWLSFDLDRDIRINYPDLEYGNVVILRRGLDALWKGAMRAIDQGEETITVNCLGQWAYIDDVNHGGQQRIWCDSRYKKWPVISDQAGAGTGYTPQLYELMNDNRLFFAPRKGETFRTGIGLDEGAMMYCIDRNLNATGLLRVSWDYDVLLTSDWTFELWDEGALLWQIIGVTQSGVKDIALAMPRSYLRFTMYKGTGPATYTGNTGISCYAEVTNLRVWGQSTESPSIIHVAEAVIDENTELDTSHDRVQEQLFVRDTFTDPNGTPLANHQPDTDKERGGWTVHAGGFDIQGNQANITAVPGLATVDSGVSDGIVWANIGIANTYPRLIFRLSDSLNYWYVQLDHNNALAELCKVVAGAPTRLSFLNIGWEQFYWYDIMVELRGDRIDVYSSGIWRYGCNDAFNETATRHGIGGTTNAGNRWETFEVYQAHPIWPMFYEDGESGYGAIRDCASFGDWNYKAVGWGVESGGDRVFLRQADRESVRYVIPPQYLAQATSRGDTHREFYTSAWAKYKDEEGIWRWTDKYYVHVTNTGLEVNTTATGDDLASVIYGVDRDHTVDFGRVDENVAVAYLIQWLMERGHPQVKSSYRVYGPVQDLGRGGSLIDPAEMEVGYVVQIPFFRAVEAEGAVGSDLRDYDTTFLLVGLEHDDERGITSLIPEGATEDLQRIIAYARAFQKKEEREHITKRSEVIGG